MPLLSSRYAYFGHFFLALTLGQIDYSAAVNVVEAKLLELIQHPDALLIIAVDDADKVIGFVSLHFIPQLGVEGGFCRISYFRVDQQRVITISGVQRRRQKVASN